MTAKDAGHDEMQRAGRMPPAMNPQRGPSASLGMTARKATATAKDAGHGEMQRAGRSDFEAPVESIGLQKPEMPPL